MVDVPHSKASRRKSVHPNGLPIETARLKLRPFVPGDAAKVLQMSQEESMRTWLWSQVYRDEGHAALAYLISRYSIADPAIAPYALGVQVRESSALIGHASASGRKRTVRRPPEDYPPWLLFDSNRRVRKPSRRYAYCYRCLQMIEDTHPLPA